MQRQDGGREQSPDRARFWNLSHSFPRRSNDRLSLLVAQVWLVVDPPASAVSAICCWDVGF